jgi:hypothetical protein
LTITTKRKRERKDLKKAKDFSHRSGTAATVFCGAMLAIADELWSHSKWQIQISSSLILIQVQDHQAEFQFFCIQCSLLHLIHADKAALLLLFANIWIMTSALIFACVIPVYINN